MEEKTLIDQAFVKKIQKGNTRKYRFVMGVLIASAVLATCAGGVAGLLFGLLVCGPIVIGMMWYRRRAGGELQVYFIMRALGNKHTSYRSYDDEPGGYDVYYLDFDKSFEVSERRYNNAYVGEPYYVMYNAYNERIVDVYPAAEYNLDPSVDIRQ